MGDYMTVVPLQVAQDTTQAWIQCGVDLVSRNWENIIIIIILIIIFIIITVVGGGGGVTACHYHDH
jgi:hypothetical protein